jgi:DNA-binding protein H-NS
MPARNLRNMDADALIALRAQVDRRLADRRAELEQQIKRLAGSVTVRRDVRGRRSTKGGKVPPKYRGPQGETWAGRGARPRWLVALLKQGHKLDEFSIDKAMATRKRSAAKVKRRAATKSRRKRSASTVRRKKK